MHTHAELIEWAKNLPKPPQEGKVRLMPNADILDILDRGGFTNAQIYEAFKEKGLPVQPTLRGFGSAKANTLRYYRAKEAAKAKEQEHKAKRKGRGK